MLFSFAGKSSFRGNLNYYNRRSASRDTGWLFFIKIFSFWLKVVFSSQIIAINKLDIFELMSFATYYMHLIFGIIPSLMSYDLVFYILPALTISILFFSLQIMFFKTPKLRKVK